MIWGSFVSWFSTLAPEITRSRFFDSPPQRTKIVRRGPRFRCARSEGWGTGEDDLLLIGGGDFLVEAAEVVILLGLDEGEGARHGADDGDLAGHRYRLGEKNGMVL